MPLSQFCTDANWAWDGEFGSAFHYTNEEGKHRTVFRYRIPFPQEQECTFLKMRGISQQNKLAYYRNLVRCIQRQVTVSKHLAQTSVNSILTYSGFEQERTDDGITSIYLETEQVWPIMNRLLVGEVSALTLLDVISRLAVILRDIAKEPAAVIHRGLDMREVYISAENKILLGGFYYAACSKLGPYPEFLPGGPSNVPATIRQGNPGAHRTDIMSLSNIAWNLFSGLPHDSTWNSVRRVAPEYSFPELNNALLMGLYGEDEVCNAFRRRLSECRKILNKPDSPQLLVPIRTSLEKEIITDLVPANEFAEADQYQ